MGKHLRDALKRIVGTIRGNIRQDIIRKGNHTLWSLTDLHCGRMYVFTLWTLRNLHCGRWCDFTLWSPTKCGYAFFAINFFLNFWFYG